MENLADAFDQPLESRDHRVLFDIAWMGGELVSVRYWLGRLLGRNFFRETDEAVEVALRNYFVEHGCEKGSRLVSDLQSWSPIAILLCHRVETNQRSKPTKNPRLVAAIQATMRDPTLTDSELAAIANTTEKQIARMSDVHVLRKLWKLQIS